jgi:predicted unusual protein kinase regulating ubiquinone biosynthesis (AarF/ABC1/UbiB family)
MLQAGRRRRKAYFTFFRVGLSYFNLWMCSKIRGKAYWNRRLPSVHQRNAERVRATIHHLQGLFIKFGQLISTLSNVLPTEFRAPLESLQDNVPPHSFQNMAATIQREFGVAPDQMFDSIDEQPIAAASIGQVHRGKIGDKEVVVKIQHPTIDNLVAVDLYIIKKIVGWGARILKIKGIEHLYKQVEQMIEEELDYTLEAQSMQQIKKNLQADARIYIPEVYTTHSSKKVLTLEYCEGVKISDVAQIQAWGFSLESYSKLLVEVYCNQILRDGFYHADPHPGNLLVNRKGQLVFLDFGAVAHLSDTMKAGIPLLLESLLKQDTQSIVRMLRKLGFVAPGNDITQLVEKLVDDVQDFVYNELQLDNLNVQNISPEQFRKGLKLINIRALTQIVQIPKDWVLLNRAVVLVGGVIFTLSPDWNPVESIQPYMKQHLRNARGSLLEVLLQSVKSQLRLLNTLPAELQKALKKINRGKLTFEHEAMQYELKSIRLLGQQLVWLLLGVASIYFYLDTRQSNADFAYYFQLGGIVSFSLFCWAFIRSKYRF